MQLKKLKLSNFEQKTILINVKKKKKIVNIIFNRTIKISLCIKY